VTNFCKKFMFILHIK